jgi:hypothetical protein
MIHTTVLTYTDAKGEAIAQAACEPDGTGWTVRLVGPVGWERDGGGIPHALRDATTIGLRLDHVTDVNDAAEALSRIGGAIEGWQEAITEANNLLVRRVALAQEYGKAAELPLGAPDLLGGTHAEERRQALERGERA